MGKKTKKIKAKPVSLSEFLGGEISSAGGSAVVIPKTSYGEDNDEFEESRYTGERIVLPTAPRQARGSDVDPEQISNDPPYIAYVGNLPFEVEDEDVERFFTGIQVKSIRLPREGSDYGRFKGFGYVEFETKADLIEALGMHEEMMKNRKIRVDIAEEESGGGRRGGNFSRGSREGGLMEEREDRSGDVSDWRAAPSKSESSGPDRNTSSYRGFESRGDDSRSDRFGGDRGGSRYEPPRSSNSRFGDRSGGGRFEERSSGGRFEERSSGGRFEERSGGGRFEERSGGGRFEERSGGGRFEERSSGGRFEERSGGGRFEERSGGGGRSRESDVEQDEKWRGRNRGEADEPKERPKLNLAPRSKQKEEDTTESTSSKPSIFGSAKPVNTAAREFEIEKRWTKSEQSEVEEVAPQPKRQITVSKDIFGAAKPVDTTAREKEIEEKLHSQDRPERPLGQKTITAGKFIVRKSEPESDRRRNASQERPNKDHNEPTRAPRQQEERKQSSPKEEPAVLDTANKFADLGFGEEEA